MAISVIILGFVFQFLISYSETLSGILSIIFLFSFIFGFEAGIGSLFWPLLTETFPEQYRDAGASMGNVLQWTFNIILSALFPFLIDALSQGIVFWGFGVAAVICLVFLFFKLPETKVSQDSGSSVQYPSLDPYSPAGAKLTLDEHVLTDVEEAF